MCRAVVTVLAVLVVLAGVAGATSPNTPDLVDNERPLADAGLDQDVDRGATVLLDGTGSRDPDGRIVEYEWSITRPGGTTTEPDCVDCPRTRFVPNATGQFAVTLTVTDDEGATATDTLYVDVSPGKPPTVELTGPSRVSRNRPATYVADAEPGTAPLDRVVWRIDGRTIATQDIDDTSTVTRPIAIPSVGSHRVTATVHDRDGQTAVDEHAVDIEADSDDGGDGPADGNDGSGGPADGNDGGADSDAGGDDGGADSSDEDSCKSNCSDDGNPSPTAILVADATRVDQGSSVSFDATASSDNGEIEAYEWSMGKTSLAADGPTHVRTFDDPGTYTVTVTATDDGRPSGTPKRASDSVEIEVCDGTCDSSQGNENGGSTRWILDIDGPRRVTLVNTETGSYVEPVVPVYTVNLETTAENEDTEVTPWFTEVRFYLEDENGRTLDSWYEGSRTQAASREIDMEQYLSGVNAPEKLYVRAEVTKNGTTYDVLREVETCVKWSSSDEPGCGTDDSIPPFTVNTTGPAEIMSGESASIKASYGQVSYYNIRQTDWVVPLLGTGGSGKSYKRSFVVPEDNTRQIYRVSVEAEAAFRTNQFDSIDKTVIRRDDGAHYITVKRNDTQNNQKETNNQKEISDSEDSSPVCPSSKERLADKCVDDDIFDIIDRPDSNVDNIGYSSDGGRDGRTKECPQGRKYDEKTDTCVDDNGGFTDWGMKNQLLSPTQYFRY